MMCLSCNEHTTPKVVLIGQQEYEQMLRRVWSTEEETCKSQKEDLDELFDGIIKESLADRQVSTVFLIGDGFKEDWARESLRTLCRGGECSRETTFTAREPVMECWSVFLPAKNGSSMFTLGRIS